MGCSIFISYATDDFNIFRIDDIARHLEQYEGINKVVYYQREKYIDIYDFINENIRVCDVMVLLCSHEASQSDYVKMEWKPFLKFKKPIIPIFKDQKDIPPLLSTYRGIYFSSDNFESFLEELTQLVIDEGEITQKFNLIRNFFGENAFKSGAMVISLPVFYPRTVEEFVDDFQKTMMKKKESTPEGLKEIIVPVYHRVIVMEDMQAGEQIKELLALYDIEVKFEIDENILNEYKHPSCFICIGGQRSNLKQNEVLNNIHSAQDLFEMHDIEPNLENFRICILPNADRSFFVGVEEHHGLGVIYRVSNPINPSDKIIGLFGDRADSTLALSKYFKDNFEKINDMVKLNPDFVLLISFTGENFSIPKLMYIGAPKEDIFIDMKELKSYIKEGGIL